MGKFLIGIAVGILLVPVCLYLYARSGYAPVAAAAAPMPFERLFTQTALHATIDREAPRIQLGHVTRASLDAGAKLYRQECAVCHGLPGEATSPQARGMFPRPPQFFRPNAEKIDDPPGEVYWKIENGIRLTGMLGFGASLANQQVREIDELLEDSTTLPSNVVSTLKSGGSAAAARQAARRTSSHHR